MKTRPLGRTGLQVSTLSFGASSLGGVFHAVDEADAIRAVHTAFDLGINYFDVAPAYGGTRSETVLGKALHGIPRESYFLSTKIGKYTNPEKYGDDTLDYSRERTRRSIGESAARLGTDYFDIIHIHDIEYGNRQHTEQALAEGFGALSELKKEGRIGAVSFGIYPMDLWQRIMTTLPVDAALVHNHYSLHDTRLLDLLPLSRENGIGLINASPFGSGLLTDRGPAHWHPANQEQRAVFKRAADHCAMHGTNLSKLALQFSSQNPDIPTTLFSSSNPDSVKRNVEWAAEPFDPALLAEVREILKPVTDIDWFP
jgi:aryl-alcohol dehydrogenase-like predicted oxidoreductase